MRRQVKREILRKERETGRRLIDFRREFNSILRGGNDDSWSLVRSMEGHSTDVMSVAFSCDGQYLASGSADNTIKLWGNERLLGRKQGAERMKHLLAALKGNAKRKGRDVYNLADRDHGGPLANIRDMVSWYDATS